MSKSGMKKTISFGEKYHYKSGKLLSFFHFIVQKKKNKIGSENVTRNKAFILANLTHNRIVIVKNNRVQLFGLNFISFV